MSWKRLQMGLQVCMTIYLHLQNELAESRAFIRDNAIRLFGFFLIVWWRIVLQFLGVVGSFTCKIATNYNLCSNSQVEKKSRMLDSFMTD